MTRNSCTLTDDELVQLRANAFEYRSPGEPDGQPSMIERALATIAARDAAIDEWARRAFATQDANEKIEQVRAEEIARLTDERGEARACVVAMEVTVERWQAHVAKLETALHRLWDLHHLSEGAIEVIRAALERLDGDP